MTGVSVRSFMPNEELKFSLGVREVSESELYASIIIKCFIINGTIKLYN